MFHFKQVSLITLVFLCASIVSADYNNRLKLVTKRQSAAEAQELSKRDETEPFTQVVFTPPPDYVGPHVTYPRVIKLREDDTTLMATWENLTPDSVQRYAPIFQSLDGGHTWAEFSRVQDTANNWGLRFQPFLYELPCEFAGYPKGTILLAANASPPDQSKTSIDVYASTDGGQTWSFLSNVAQGGAAKPDNGVPAIWEPFLFLVDDTLICYYSDQRDPLHGQKLVYQYTTDLQTWSDVVDIVASPTYADRPGMATVAQLGTGQFILTYEFCCSPAPVFRVAYKISDDPFNFIDKPQILVVADDGTIPVSSPYARYTPAEGGMVLLSCGTSGDLFYNKAQGDESAWQHMPTDSPASYSRSMAISGDRTGVYFLSAGAPDTQNNIVTLAYLPL